jgi:hypothetical protein
MSCTFAFSRSLLPHRLFSVSSKNSILSAALGARERERLWLWRPCAVFWTPRIRGFGHSWSPKPPG